MFSPPKLSSALFSLRSFSLAFLLLSMSSLPLCIHFLSFSKFFSLSLPPPLSRSLPLPVALFLSTYSYPQACLRQQAGPAFLGCRSYHFKILPDSRCSYSPGVLRCTGHILQKKAKSPHYPGAQWYSYSLGMMRRSPYIPQGHQAKCPVHTLQGRRVCIPPEASRYSYFVGMTRCSYSPVLAECPEFLSSGQEFMFLRDVKDMFMVSRDGKVFIFPRDGKLFILPRGGMVFIVLMVLGIRVL